MAEARKDLEQVRRLARQSMENELVSIREEAKHLSDQEEFHLAVRAIEQARTRHSDALWGLGIERALEDVRADVEKRFETVKKEAVEARRRGEEKEVNSIRERVARWARPKLLATLDAYLAARPPLRLKKGFYSCGKVHSPSIAIDLWPSGRGVRLFCTIYGATDKLVCPCKVGRMDLING